MEEKIKKLSSGVRPTAPEQNTNLPSPSDIIQITSANPPAANRFEWRDGDLGVKWQFDCDFPGSDFKSFPNTRGEDCGGLCVKFENECNTFSHFFGTCFLKFFRLDRLISNGIIIPAPATGGICGYVPSRVQTISTIQRPECPTNIGSNSMCQAVNEPNGCYCIIDQWVNQFIVHNCEMVAQK